MRPFFHTRLSIGSQPLRARFRAAPPGHSEARRAAVFFASTIALLALGCGMAGSPQPPSLHLPKPVHDLTAARVGNRVKLGWTTPKENTDHLKLQSAVRLRICRQQKSGPCKNLSTISGTSGKTAEYFDTLPALLVAGALRPVSYEISGINKHGRSAGPSNSATALAGEAPPVIQQLSATTVPRGVMLRWQPVAGLPPGTFVLLRRTLIPSPASKKQKPSGLRPTQEPIEQTLQVDPRAGQSDPGAALDANASFGRTYRYVATRVTRVKSRNLQLEADSDPSQPVTIVTRDTFPPAAPSGLVAVPVSASMNDGRPEVDLSWSANVEPDLARYIVERSDTGSPHSRPVELASGDQPLISPAYRDLHVQPGHTYRYFVIAVDAAGNRSPHSAEVTATVPAS